MTDTVDTLEKMQREIEMAKAKNSEPLVYTYDEAARRKFNARQGAEAFAAREMISKIKLEERMSKTSGLIDDGNDLELTALPNSDQAGRDRLAAELRQALDREREDRLSGSREWEDPETLEPADAVDVYQDTLNRMEPSIGSVDDLASLASIAISLKRLVDIVERQFSESGQEGVDGHKKRLAYIVGKLNAIEAAKGTRPPE